jgi:serpin B
MGIAFATYQADFAGLAPGAYVSEVYHSTAVQVDESGTTAAAATGVTITTTIATVQAVMNMDHPFLYVIEDAATGELLFIGILMNPAVSATAASATAG